MIVRREHPGDAAEIAHLIDSAFGDAETSVFTAELRASPGYVPELTFVAEEDGEIVGFTMLSYVRVEDRRVLILTLMAVRPDRHRAGVGRQVVRAAIAAADERGELVILVEGVPSYYPQFGFRSATALGLERPDERIPDEAWMALPLRAYDPQLRGSVVYPDFFPAPPAID
ncbi:MAG TPA: N-acetyltransferase [Gaiellaceae bacterium]|nr:N-acetyltransferase [Gaiellaceae bacterium]